MISLNRHLYSLVAVAIKSSGTFDPDKNMFRIEEQITIREYDLIYGFLDWCHRNHKKFGIGNYEDVFSDYQRYVSNKTSLYDKVEKIKTEYKEIKTEVPSADNWYELIEDYDDLETRGDYVMVDGTLYKANNTED